MAACCSCHSWPLFVPSARAVQAVINPQNHAPSVPLGCAFVQLEQQIQQLDEQRQHVAVQLEQLEGLEGGRDQLGVADLQQQLRVSSMQAGCGPHWWLLHTSSICHVLLLAAHASTADMTCLFQSTEAHAYPSAGSCPAVKAPSLPLALWCLVFPTASCPLLLDMLCCTPPRPAQSYNEQHQQATSRLSDLDRQFESAVAQILGITPEQQPRLLAEALQEQQHLQEVQVRCCWRR